MSDETQNGPDFDRLTEPFGPDRVEWRVRKSGMKSNGPWARVVPYPDARAVMDRLDEACGHGGWRDDYREGPAGGVLCGISIRVGGEWVTKWDGADNTDVESVKGGLTDSFKRAAVKWNVGAVRELYRMGDHWAEFHDDGRYRDKIDGQWFAWDPPMIDLRTGEIRENGASRSSPAPKRGSTEGSSEKAASKKQVGYIERLLEEREVGPNAREQIRGKLKAGMSSPEASTAIEFLQERPEKEKAEAGGDGLPF